MRNRRRWIFMACLPDRWLAKHILLPACKPSYATFPARETAGIGPSRTCRDFRIAARNPRSPAPRPACGSCANFPSRKAMTSRATPDGLVSLSSSAHADDPVITAEPRCTVCRSSNPVVTGFPAVAGNDMAGKAPSHETYAFHYAAYFGRNADLAVFPEGPNSTRSRCPAYLPTTVELMQRGER